LLHFAHLIIGQRTEKNDFLGNIFSSEGLQNIIERMQQYLLPPVPQFQESSLRRSKANIDCFR
jgi:hypothetical protein